MGEAGPPQVPPRRADRAGQRATEPHRPAGHVDQPARVPGVRQHGHPGLAQLDGEQPPAVRHVGGDQRVGEPGGERAPRLVPLELPPPVSSLTGDEGRARGLRGEDAPRGGGGHRVTLARLRQDRDGVEMGLQHPRGGEVDRGDGREQLPALQGLARAGQRHRVAQPGGHGQRGLHVGVAQAADDVPDPGRGAPGTDADGAPARRHRAGCPSRAPAAPTRHAAGGIDTRGSLPLRPDTGAASTPDTGVVGAGSGENAGRWPRPATSTIGR